MPATSPAYTTTHVPGASQRVVRSASVNHHEPSVPEAYRRAATQNVAIAPPMESSTVAGTRRRGIGHVVVPIAITIAIAATGKL